jgi:hypothetical protein
VDKRQIAIDDATSGLVKRQAGGGGVHGGSVGGFRAAPLVDGGKHAKRGLELVFHFFNSGADRLLRMYRIEQLL